MSPQSIGPDDPRLSAYVLGELDESQRHEVERLLEHSPNARAEVEAIRETAALLHAELAAEPAVALTAEQRAAIEQEAARSPHAVKQSRRWPKRLAVALSGLVTVAAAVILLVLVPERAEEQLALRSSAKLSEGYYLRDDAQLVPNDQDGLESLERLSKESLAAKAGRAVLSNELSSLGSHGSQRGRVSGDPALAQNGQPRSYYKEAASAGASEVSGGGVPLLRGVRLMGETAGAGNGTSYGVPVSSQPTEAAAGASITTTNLGRPQLEGASDQKLYFYADPKSGVVANDAISVVPPSNAPVPGVTDNLGLQTVVPQQQTVDVKLFGKQPAVASRLETVLRRRVDPLQEAVDDNYALSEDYHPITENDFLSPQQQPLSTFSIDVDTGSYSNMRRFLNQGQLPPPNAVRIEELINYFSYDDPAPGDGEPFSVRMETGPCPWNVEHRLLRVGLKGQEIPREQRPPSNLVFLLDVSGSMRDDNKLPLVKLAMELLVSEMTEDDRIAIVTYAGNAGLALDSMSGEYREEILSTIRNLQAGGSTNGEAGIRLAYEKAVEHFVKEGSNRVILCTDGDFNVGMSDDDALVSLIQQQAKSGVFLSVFGFGMGNLKDGKLEQLADKGNGHYGYIDNFREARKVFFEELTGTLYTIAKDVKIQIEFNPAQVGAYRLVGYENRVMAAEDFHDDTKDAGEIGAGHSVTALYELVPAGQVPKHQVLAGLKYQPTPGIEAAPAAAPASEEWLTLSLRYKQPDGDKSVLKEYPLQPAASAAAGESSPGAQRSHDFHWTAAVAAFGMILRHSAHRGQADFDLVLELAGGSLGDDAGGDRSEFVELVRKAENIQSQ